ncbi:helix-turn-helix domain-containing protein [Bradyrhizobium cajani]|uniref:Helix-turn-helix domain-containing protein n=1 Tax=Bradyrhizobium cajani TaxID=1928661 RepID=A0A844T0L8_9BRAD|nr:helix-turn-helix transcriptional regulator [Bradyrhizobium cajani]MCP3371615.1 helix-turn-helix domain-containing protein [Bradyrhizobium cajani]MVT72337.1 helix-turn-helix domain-containing protein [Bradyrhizobium cajani]
MAGEKTEEPHSAEGLGRYLKSARLGSKMTLRDVEEATGKEVSNAYLSQLESGKIAKPSVNVLYALSTSLGVPYETLMERAGYIVPTNQRAEAPNQSKAATYSIDNLTADEEKELLDYLNYIRSKRK